jgi:ketosteroid isomerase-like protein
MILGTLAAVSLAAAVPAAARTAPVTQATLLDRVQIEDMMVEYYTLLTGGAIHDVGEYFADDAVLVANGTRIEGKAAIQRIYESGADLRIVKGNKYNMIITSPRITVNGDTATMDAIWTGFLSDNVWSTPRLLEQGTERSIFKKVKGVWMITSRTITHDGGRADFFEAEG